MIPARLTSPIVGLIPTRPFAAEGQTMEPSVSVPTPTAAKLAATAAPVPELRAAGRAIERVRVPHLAARARSTRWRSGWSGSSPTRSGWSSRG